MTRGNNKEAVFKNEWDKEKLIDILKKVMDVEKCKIHGYCIMDNHLHLLIDENGQEISRIMKRINVSYAMYYNERYDKIGHVFQDRYKSKNIEDDQYLLAVLRYIHNNPLKPKMADVVGAYQWSSYNAYINGENDLIDSEYILGLFDEDKEKAIRRFMEFHEYEDDHIYLEDREEQRAFEENRAWDIVEDSFENYGGKVTLEMKKVLAKKLIHETKLSKRKIAEMLEMDRNIVQRIGRKRGS